LGYGKITEYEESLIKAALKELNANISAGEKFAASFQ
jgi:hypothetical protein